MKARTITVTLEIANCTVPTTILRQRWRMIEALCDYETGSPAEHIGDLTQVQVAVRQPSKPTKGK